MKFPKPRVLLQNEHPDLNLNQPEIYRKLIKEIVYPEHGSVRDRYLEETIKILKNKAKQKVKAAKLNEIFINKDLYFIPVYIKNKLRNDQAEPIKSLIDTGAANSLIQYDVAKSLGIKYDPIQITLKTATGEDKDTVKGIAHQKIFAKTTKGKIVGTCINLIVTEKLNDLDLILGADFLFMNDKIKTISKNDITWHENEVNHKIKIEDDNSYPQAISGPRNKKIKYEFRLANCAECNDTRYKLSTQQKLPSAKKWDEKINLVGIEEYISHKEKSMNFKQEVPNHQQNDELKQNSAVKLNNSEPVDPETLGPSESAFEDQLELDFKILDKKLSLEDADYSECPPNI